MIKARFRPAKSSARKTGARRVRLSSKNDEFATDRLRRRERPSAPAPEQAARAARQSRPSRSREQRVPCRIGRLVACGRPEFLVERHMSLERTPWTCRSGSSGRRLTLEHFSGKWTFGFPQKMRRRKESRARLSTFSGQRKRNAL
jgi:hypothetical protein